MSNRWIALAAVLLVPLARGEAAGQGADVQFLHCVPTAPGALQYQCSIAGPCAGLPCGASGWLPVEGVQSLPASFFVPGGTRASAIQVTPEAVAGSVYTLVNKDVAGQRWAIIQDGATGVVTGNVFSGAGASAVQFLYCPDFAAGDVSVVFSGCRIASACGETGCQAGDWQPVSGGAEVVASFFAPAPGRSSGLQRTPDSETILVSKDLAAQRWTISALATQSADAFPLGIGPVFGNVFEVELAPATLDNVLRTHADIAHAVYEDSLETARALRQAVGALVAAPSPQALAAARAAWIAAREPYGQSEVHRFQRGPIDVLRDDGTLGEDGDGPEGRINSWPLGEALIDYVAPHVDGDAGPESPGSVAGVNGNVIADAAHFPDLSPAALADLNELGGDERNVATGYHAIEFLLWGQDLNADGTPGFSGRDATPGQRPYTDFLPDGAGCTHGNCARRGQYLVAATDLLIQDLERIVAAWNPDGGVYHAQFVAGGKVSLAKILEGMGRLAFGEMAGERMNIALVTNTQEDEQSCFSVNTHRDFLLDGQGIRNVWLGRYTRVDGRVVAGPGPDALLRAQGGAALADQMTARIDDAQAKLAVIDARAKGGVPVDNQIQEGINEPNFRAAIQALIDEIPTLEEVIDALDVQTGDLCQDTEQFECEL
jgi:putative iron-regulated protein